MIHFGCYTIIWLQATTVVVLRGRKCERFALSIWNWIQHLTKFPAINFKNMQANVISNYNRQGFVTALGCVWSETLLPIGCETWNDDSQHVSILLPPCHLAGSMAIGMDHACSVKFFDRQMNWTDPLHESDALEFTLIAAAASEHDTHCKKTQSITINL